MSSLVFERNLARFAAARLVSSFGSGRGAGVGPLRLLDTEAPDLPTPSWHRVRPLLAGICGSDLATLDGRSSRYFEDLVSFPFVPGHEVVGVVEDGAVAADGTRLDPGTRVILEPVLGCAARGIVPPCPACAAGATGDCEHVAHGHLRPGLQTGFCADTGGGWSSAGFVAHQSQLHTVPTDMPDEDAVTVEPVACAVHAVLRAGLRGDEVVAVLGAGTVGLTLTGALAHLSGTGRCPAPSALLVGARHAHQRALAIELGATATYDPDGLSRAVRRRSRSLALGAPRTGGQQLTGGADVVFDCVGSAESITQSLAMVRPRGRVVLVGMPGRVHIDLATLWHREVSLSGAYAYGIEHVRDASGVGQAAGGGGVGGGPEGGGGGPEAGGVGPEGVGTEAGGSVPVRTFDLALQAVAALGTGRLVSALYPLERFEEALGHAGAAGRRGAVKIAFDLRRDRHARKGPAA